MGQYRKHISMLFLWASISLGCLGSLSILLDPLQVFHDQYRPSQLFSNNMRYQAAGLIRFGLKPGRQYSSIIIGTSMSENFSPLEVSTTLGWGKTLPLELSGGTPKEKYTVLKKALDTGQVRQVLFEVLDTYATDDLDLVADKDFPFYLYGDLPVQYVFNVNTIWDGIKLYLGRLHWKSDLDTLTNWMDEVQEKKFSEFNSPESLKSLKTALQGNESKWESCGPYKCPPDAFPSVDAYILAPIANNPDVQFLLFFPPYSLQRWAEMSCDEVLHTIGMYEYLVHSLHSYPNSRIAGFDQRIDITGNLANYKDKSHYHPKINSLMLRLLHNDAYCLDNKNWDAYKTKLLNSIMNYSTYSDSSNSIR